METKADALCVFVGGSSNLSFFDWATVSYAGDDTYAVDGQSQGRPIALQFLSRKATALFLFSALAADQTVNLQCDDRVCISFSDATLDSMMETLLILRDARHGSRTRLPSDAVDEAGSIV